MVPVSVRYWYDSYGVFYDLRKPKNVSSRTDVHGQVVLQLANYSGGIDITVGDTWFRVEKDTILRGGQPRGVPESGVAKVGYREIELRISPAEPPSSEKRQ